MTTETERERASDSGHWYWPDGRTAYTVPYRDKKRNGEERPTTIKDARDLGLYPSVTTILKMIPAPALEDWKMREVAKFCASSGFIGLEESIPEWASWAVGKAKDVMAIQRNKGSEAHGIVERYYRGEFGLKHPAIDAVRDAMDSLGFDGLNEAEKSFASPLGYGGKIDLCKAMDARPWMSDFKFVSRLDKKLDYIERCAQGSAYIRGKWFGLDTRHARFANIFVSTEDWSWQTRLWTSEELDHGWCVFDRCFDLWKTLNKFYP